MAVSASLDLHLVGAALWALARLYFFFLPAAEEAFTNLENGTVQKPPVKVAVTGAAGAIGYLFAFFLRVHGDAGIFFLRGRSLPPSVTCLSPQGMQCSTASPAASCLAPTSL